MATPSAPITPTEPLGCNLIDPVDHPPLVLSTDGVIRELANGEIINSAGTSQAYWTVGGKGLLFDDGTSTSPCADGSTLSGLDLQTAYNNSANTGGTAKIKLQTGKDFSIYDDTDDGLFFRIDSETGKVTISGDLEVRGSSTTINTIVQDADHWLISPAAGTTTALKIEPDLGVTPIVDIVNIRRKYGETPVVRVDKDGNLIANLNLTVGGLINGIDLVQHVEGIAFRHTAYDIDVVPEIPTIPGATNVHEALQKLSTQIGNPGATNGMAIPLAAAGGFPSDGDWTPGAVPLNDQTLVTDAIDKLNELLSLLIPAAPLDLGSIKNFNIPSVGLLPLKAAGEAPDNTAGGDLSLAANTAGNPVVAANVSGRITSARPSSTILSKVGSGSAGILAVEINGTTAPHALPEFTKDAMPVSLTVGATVMTARGDFPIATPGFWKSFDVQAVADGDLLPGWNRARVTHSESGNTNYFMALRDDLTALSALSAQSVTEVGNGGYAFSSGVPHYGDLGGSLQVYSAIMTNLAGETYYGGNNPVSFLGSNGIILPQDRTYTDLGITTPIERQTLAATRLTDQNINVNGTNIHGSGVVQGIATNVNGPAPAVNLASTVILVKRGSAGSRVDEMSIPVIGLGTSPNASNATRRGGFLGTDQPAVSAGTAWVQSTALNSYDAAVVAGILSHNQINYSTGYLPVGPDLSAGRGAAQYFTCSFQRESRSNFKINVTGTYAACFVALPGISTISSSTGWWNMGVAFSGSGYPGDSTGGNGSNGCAEGSVMTGGTGIFTCTFGTKSSTGSMDNNIIVRFKLMPGQSISSLSFTN